MTMHELATNAAKYGALSVDEGRLAISCDVESEPVPRLHIRWSERGGPGVAARASGFGVRLIEEAIAYEFDGRVQLQFPRDGVCCDIVIPLRSDAR
jgi:two-component sensor histidine kinase